MKTTRSIRGQFVIWEPDGKSPPGHRLLDSDRPYTSYFKYGRLTTDGETVFLKKSRNFVRVLAFVASTPLWGAIIIGLMFLLDFLSVNLTSKHPGLIILFVTGIVISVFVALIRKFIKPIRRQYPRSQIANVRMKQVQTSQYAPTRMGWVGVDFSVMPPGSFIESVKGGGSIRIADPEKCSFVTFVALGESEAKFLGEWLPTTQVALVGNLDANIPPQHVAPRISTQTEAAGRNQSSSHAGIHSEKRPSHTASQGFRRLMRVINVLLFGYLAPPGSSQAEVAGGNQFPIDAGMNTGKRYSHNVSPWYLAALAVGDGLFAFFLGRTAVTNKRGLIINGAIHLGPTGATIFYFLITAFFAVAFILLAGVALQSIFNPHSLLLNQEGIAFFKGWLKPKKTFIPFKSIEGLLQQQGVKGGSRSLILVVKGQRFTIKEECLSHPRIYPEICAAIASGQKNSRTVSEKRPPIPDDDSRYMPKA